MRFSKFFLAASTAALLLSACETAPTNDGSVVGDNAGSVDMSAGYGAVDTSVVPGTQADLEANVGDRIFYATDSSVVNAEAQATLERQAAWMVEHSDVNVTIEGHADERGTREYNLALGERRANAAKNYLVGLGINPARVSTISYGKERPAVLGHNEAAWGKNRRAVTVVVE